MSLLNALVLAWSLLPLAGMFVALWYASSLRAAGRRSGAAAPLRARRRL